METVQLQLCVSVMSIFVRSLLSTLDYLHKDEMNEPKTSDERNCG